jgi:hypothetical protein
MEDPPGAVGAAGQQRAGAAVPDRAGVRGGQGQQGSRGRARGASGHGGKWRSRFIRSRLDGLADEDRPGRLASITLDQVEAVVVATLEDTPKDATHWSRASMAGKSGLSRSADHRCSLDRRAQLVLVALRRRSPRG